MAGPYPRDPSPSPLDRRPKRDLAEPPFRRGRFDRSPRLRGAAPGRRGATEGPADAAGDPPGGESRGARLDPASLPIPSLSRRRLATIAGALAVAWLVIAFGRQVGEASAASSRADDLRSGNAALRQSVATLQDDLARVQDPRFVQLQGRAFGLGGPHEIPFTIEANAPALAADAPGSAAVRLGAERDRRSPLDAWLSTLFGSGG